MNERRGRWPATIPSMSDFRVLVVQPDNPADSPGFTALMRIGELTLSWVRDATQARQLLSSTPQDLVVLDADLPGGSGLDLIAESGGVRRNWPTIVLAGRGDVRSAVVAMRRGAFDVIEKPVDASRLGEAVEHLRARALGRPARPAGAGSDATGALSCDAGCGEVIVGRTHAIHRLREQIRAIAPIPTDVLVVGETGTGKDLVARQLHALSGRRGPLIAVNCGAIPDTLFESELFGHEAGSFTGALKRQSGKIEQSDAGTLFLDEIESMPLNQQVKLLRVLETRRVARVGGQSERELDLRIVAAAQAPLGERCSQGLFRLDLWHRLNVVCLELPALRDRCQDIEPLFLHYVQGACARFNIPAPVQQGIDWHRLLTHDWPGNVRELKHAAERHVLGLPLLDAAPSASSTTTTGLTDRLEACERELILKVLEKHDNRQGPAAAELGISQKTLSRRMAEYELRPRRRPAAVGAPKKVVTEMRPGYESSNHLRGAMQ